MAGGIGSRFWPMSTPQRPKQFLDITGCGRTMIQQTFDRYEGIIDIEHVWVVTSENYKDFPNMIQQVEDKGRFIIQNKNFAELYGNHF